VDSVVAKRPIEELINFACSLSKVYRHFKFEFSIAGGVREEGEGLMEKPGAFLLFLVPSVSPFELER
jgi:hypothetical protein